jgi:hypothetical protein
MTSNLYLDAAMVAAFPEHDLMGRIPLVDNNPCNGVGCGCHPSTEPTEPDWSTR